MSTPTDPIWGNKGASLVPSSRSTDKYSVLSSVEKLLIRECQEEAFYQRSLPLSICFGFGIHSLYNQGYINMHIFERVPRQVVKWGLVAGAGVMGFWMGQLSYSNHCVTKFLERAPDGVVALDIRMKGN